MKRRVKLLYFLITVGLLFFIPSVGAQAITLNVTLNTVSPVYNNGNCPIRVSFNGNITLSSATQLASPVTVKYRFKRSDGATDAVKTLIFNQTGTQNLSDTWDIGGVDMPSYCGWESIEIISPQSVESNHAPFTILCNNVALPAFHVTDIYSILPGTNKCTIGFKIKNIGGNLGPDCSMNALLDRFDGSICNGTTCSSISLPVKSNIRNSGGEDTYTDYWYPWLLDFSKPFTVKLRLKRNESSQPTFSLTGNEFNLSKDVKCLTSLPNIQILPNPLK